MKNILNSIALLGASSASVVVAAPVSISAKPVASPIETMASPVSALTVTGTVWANYLATFEGDKKNVGASLTRALLGAKYQFDDNWSAHLSFINQSILTVSMIKTYDAFVRYSDSNASTELGLLSDPYIEWLNAASGTRWVHESLTQKSSFRSNRFLGLQHERSAMNGTLALSLKNGDDDAYGAENMRDKSVNVSAAYKTALNDSLNGNVYAQYQTKDAQSVSANSQTAHLGLGAALAGGVEAFKVLGEFAFSKAQENGSKANLGFGVTGKFMFVEGSSFYGRFYGGNKIWQTAQGVKNNFEFGLLRDVSKNISYGSFVEFLNKEPDLRTNVRFAVAAKF